MRRVQNLLVALLASLVLCLSIPAPAQAAPCLIQVQGSVGVVVCGGIVIDRLPLPHVTVTETVTHEVIRRVPVPGPTVKVPVPGPTTTVTQPPRPGQTTIVTTPGGTKTVIIAPQPKLSPPTPTPHVGTGTRQTSPQPATIGPAKPIATPHKVINIGDGKTTPVEIGVGILTLLALLAVFFLTFYSGYVMGFREGEAEQTSFMRNLLESSKSGRLKR